MEAATEADASSFLLGGLGSPGSERAWIAYSLPRVDPKGNVEIGEIQVFGSEE